MAQINSKSDLINIVASAVDLSKTSVEDVINGTLRALQDLLSKGEKIVLVGFGTFKASKRTARQGRDPRTGKAINIPETNVVKFSAGKGLKDALNGK